MKVYVIVQSDYECGAGLSGKVFDSEEKARKYVDKLNKETYDGWLDFAKTETHELMKMRLEECGSPEAYAKDMLEHEKYFYRMEEVE
jgi:glycine cleavage system H lipoate-binding protein